MHIMCMATFYWTIFDLLVHSDTELLTIRTSSFRQRTSLKLREHQTAMGTFLHLKSVVEVEIVETESVCPGDLGGWWADRVGTANAPAARVTSVR